MLARSIIKWSDNGMNALFEKAEKEDVEIKDFAKAAGYGAAEGFLDAAVILGGTVIVLSLVSMIIGIKSEE